MKVRAPFEDHSGGIIGGIEVLSKSLMPLYQVLMHLLWVRVGTIKINDLHELCNLRVRARTLIGRTMF